MCSERRDIERGSPWLDRLQQRGAWTTTEDQLSYCGIHLTSANTAIAAKPASSIATSQQLLTAHHVVGSTALHLYTPSTDTTRSKHEKLNNKRRLVCNNSYCDCRYPAVKRLQSLNAQVKISPRALTQREARQTVSVAPPKHHSHRHRSSAHGHKRPRSPASEDTSHREAKRHREPDRSERRAEDSKDNREEYRRRRSISPSDEHHIQSSRRRPQPDQADEFRQHRREVDHKSTKRHKKRRTSRSRSRQRDREDEPNRSASERGARTHSIDRDNTRGRKEAPDTAEDMQSRGGSYSWGNNRNHSQAQYYGHPGYQYPYAQHQGYPQQAGQNAPYGQQQSQYGYQYPQGTHHSPNHFQPPSGPSYGNSTGSQHGQRATNRGGSSQRGSRAFSNMSWKASDGGRSVRSDQQEEMKSVIAAPDTSADDADNPFRPPAELRAEAEETEKEHIAQPAKTRDEDIPTGPRNQNTISFSIKPRPKPSTDTGQSEKKRATSHTRAERERSVDSIGRDTRHHEDEAKKERTSKTKIVKKKVLKAKPTLSEEHAKSDSVYYRKTGNESVVGSGTYGKVYKATHVYTGKMVALKKIRMEGERDGFPVTAIREIKLLQSLRHRNVVPLREVMVEKNDCYMVFEYLHHDLTGLLNHPSFVLSPAHKKHLAKQLFEGLDYLHRRGVLHRDIKAANILISKTGELKLADFGLARFYQKRAKEDYTNRVITIWYRPPELLLGETQYDGAVDIWSAACVLVEIFLRHAIFPGNGSEIDQLDKIYNVLGTPSRSEWPGIVELQWYELLRPQHRIKSTFADKFREQISPEAFELLQAMFLYDPANRPTAANVLDHAYFTTEEPAPAQVVELEFLEGDWHEFESKQLRKEKEKQERKRRERERDSEKRKRDEDAGGDAKKIKVDNKEA